MEMNEIIKEVYQKRLLEQLNPPNDFLKNLPPTYYPWHKKLRNKIWNFRYWLASKIAGYNVSGY